MADLPIHITATDETSSAMASAESSVGAVKGAADGAAGSVGNFGSALSAAGGSAGALSSDLAPIGNLVSGLGAAFTEAGAEGATGMAGMATGAVAAVAAIGALSAMAGSYANEIMRLQAVLGQSQETTELWGTKMQIAGGDVSQITSSIRFLETAISGSSTSKYAKDFDALGISMKNTDGSTKQAGQAFTEVIPALAAMTDAGERDRIAKDMLGRGYVNLLPLIQNYSQVTGIAAGIEAQHAGQMGNLTQTALQWNAVNTEVSRDLEALGIQILPAVAAALSAVNSVLGPVVSAFHAVGQVVSIIPEGATLVAAAFNGLIQQLSGILAPIKDLYDIAKALGIVHADTAAAATAGAAAEDTFGASAGTAGAAAAGAASAVNVLGMETTHLNDTAASATSRLQDYAIWLNNVRAAADAAGQSMAQYAADQGLNTGTTAFTGLTPAARASGGPVSAGMPYFVGEDGRELFVPSQSGTIVPNGAGGAGGGTTINIHVNAPVFGVSDLQTVIRSTTLAAMREGAYRGSSGSRYGGN